MTQKQEKEKENKEFHLKVTLKKANISIVLTAFLMLTQWLGALAQSTVFKPKIQSNVTIY